MLATEPGACRLAAQDLFLDAGAPVGGIARPTDLAALIELVATARRDRLTLLPRGGGMSYTGAVVPTNPATTIVVDMGAFDRVLEVAVADRYVHVEAGCTWAKLADALAPHGLAAAVGGPVSGRRATVGGALSMHAAFWGSARSGTVADALLGLELVSGLGERLRTGSLGVAGCNGFSRYFGPDLSGLFLGDCGTFGLKTAAVLRLEPALPADVLALRSGDAASLFAFLAEAAGLGTHVMTLDAGLQRDRIAGTGVAAAAAQLSAVRAGGGSLTRRVTDLAGLARARIAARLSPEPAQGFITHIGYEAAEAAGLAATGARISDIAARHGLVPNDPTVGRAMLRQPFAPVTGVAGSRGERWVPVHGVLPHSRAAGAFEAVQVLLREEAEAMAALGIRVRTLIAAVGAGALIVEPMFFWRDVLPEQVKATLLAEAGRLPPAHPPNPAAAALVTALRQRLAALFDAHGATHFQLGRTYAWSNRLDPATLALAAALRDHLDPDRVLAAPLFDPQAEFG
jgi:D-lactate dehydrogenase (cytochrome)